MPLTSGRAAPNGGDSLAVAARVDVEPIGAGCGEGGSVGGAAGTSVVHADDDDDWAWAGVWE